MILPRGGNFPVDPRIPGRLVGRDLAAYPFVNLRMAISEQKTGRVAMLYGRKIQPDRVIRLQIDEGIEMGIVDGVRMFIDQPVNRRGSRGGNVARLVVKLERRHVELRGMVSCP